MADLKETRALDMDKDTEQIIEDIQRKIRNIFIEMRGSREERRPGLWDEVEKLQNQLEVVKELHRQENEEADQRIGRLENKLQQAKMWIGGFAAALTIFGSLTGILTWLVISFLRHAAGLP